MPKYEYRVIALPTPGDQKELIKAREQYLNDLGREGWELVSVVDFYWRDSDEAYGDYFHEAYFKREVRV